MEWFTIMNKRKHVINYLNAVELLTAGRGLPFCRLMRLGNFLLAARSPRWYHLPFSEFWVLKASNFLVSMIFIRSSIMVVLIWYRLTVLPVGLSRPGSLAVRMFRVNWMSPVRLSVSISLSCMETRLCWVTKVRQTVERFHTKTETLKCIAF